MMSKSFLQNLLLLSFSVWATLEVAGFSLAISMPHLFESPPVFQKGEPDAQEKAFSDYRQRYYSPVTGWAAPVGIPVSEKNCKGEVIATRHDEDRLRRYPGYDKSRAEVLLLGDSYIWGYGLKDHETIASHMFRQRGVISANLAFNAFCPVQGYLRARAERAEFPAAKYVIMGIMYEDIYRMVNAYRPAYVPNGGAQRFKPYMRDGLISGLPTEPFTSFAAMQRASEQAMREDYWARPPASFPYSYALLRALTSNMFRRVVLTRLWGKSIFGFDFAFRDQYLGENLYALLVEYSRWATAEGLKPIVVFLPRNNADTQSPEYWLAHYQDRLPPELYVTNLDISRMDMRRYNMVKSSCHPSDYGAGAIAAEYLHILEKLGRP